MNNFSVWEKAMKAEEASKIILKNGVGFTDDPESLRRERANLQLQTRQDPNYISMMKLIMKNEIERKFLINPVLFLKFRKQNNYKVYFIEQTYYENPFFKIRKKNLLENQESISEFFITIKLGEGIIRQEYEEKISWEIGNYLIASKKKIKKHRFNFDNGWEVDHFLNPELQNLWIAEKELKNEKEKIKLPKFIVEEITYKEKYSNYNLWTKL